MKHEELEAAMHLASQYATQRAFRAGVMRNKVGARSIDIASANLRVARAEQRLRSYLSQFLDDKPVEVKVQRVNDGTDTTPFVIDPNAPITKGSY